MDKGPRNDRWYLKLMAPNVKGNKFAWLDPSSIYINHQAFNHLIDDLYLDLIDINCDVVAGLDAMGFVLGGALANRFSIGFLPIRKSGKLCVETDKVVFTNYTGKEQYMEMRQTAFPSGTRILVVDQWVETGGTMDAAIRLIEKQHGVVAGLASIAFEDNKYTQALRKKYFCASAVLPGSRLQTECNAQNLSSFKNYKTKDTYTFSIDH